MIPGGTRVGNRNTALCDINILVTFVDCHPSLTSVPLVVYQHHVFIQLSVDQIVSRALQTSSGTAYITTCLIIIYSYLIR